MKSTKTKVSQAKPYSCCYTCIRHTCFVMRSKRLKGMQNDS